MLIAWKVDPSAVFRPVMRNLYLVEFNSQQDMYTVTLGGPWTYRGDLVAFRKVSSQADLHPEHIAFPNLWVQFFNLPINSLTEESLDILANELGTRVSPPVDGFVNGTRFMKLKIMVAIDKPLKDIVTLDHPTLGPLKAHCYYEKVCRICLFCGKLGHEMEGCRDRLRVADLLTMLDYVGKYNVSQVLAPKLGKWLSNQGFIPNESGSPSGHRNNRHFNQDFHYGMSNPGQLGQDQQMQNGLHMPTALPSSSSLPSISIPLPKRARPAGPTSPARDL